jgi:hypothetical protein
MPGGAHAEIVGGDGADLGDEEVGGDLVFELLDGEDGFIAARAGDEVFGLDFCWPLEGVKFILKWGRRSYQGPGMPICSVHGVASWPGSGWSFCLAAVAP